MPPPPPPFLHTHAHRHTRTQTHSAQGRPWWLCRTEAPSADALCQRWHGAGPATARENTDAAGSIAASPPPACTPPPPPTATLKHAGNDRNRNRNRNPTPPALERAGITEPQEQQ